MEQVILGYPELRNAGADRLWTLEVVWGLMSAIRVNGDL